MMTPLVRLRHLLKDTGELSFLDSRSAGIAAVVLMALYAVAMAILKWLPVNDAFALAAVVWLMFLALGRCTPRTRTLVLHLATQVLVLSWVVHLWTLGYEGRNAVFGGILPWSDSFDYYDDALRLLHGNLLEYAAKRPVFATALAGLLRLFGGDLRLPLLLFAAFGAWAMALATSEVWKTHGRTAALVVYALVLLSERQWAGFVQTEHIGLPLGLIGFVLVWRAADGKTDPKQALTLAAGGLLAITIALMARAGPFFILPALALWCAMRLAPPEARWPRRVKVFAVAALAIVAGAAVHAGIAQAAASGTTFSDYPAIVYGLIHGRDFTLLLTDHPYLATLTGSAYAGEAWRIVFAEAAAHPMQLAGGLAKSFVDLFISRNGLLGFVWRNPDDIVLENGAAIRAALAQYGLPGPLVLWFNKFGLYSLFNAAAMMVFSLAFIVAALASLFLLYYRRGDSYVVMLRYAMGGVLLSAPFTPPWITSSHQVQTATLAFLAATIATVLLGRRTEQPAPSSTRLVFVPAGIGAALLLMAVFLRAAPLATPICRQADEHIVIPYPSTTVVVSPGRTLNLKERARDDLLFSIQYLERHNPEFTQSLVPYLKNGTVYVAAYDACGQRTRILVDDRGAFDLTKRGWRPIGAHPLAEPNVLRVLPHE